MNENKDDRTSLEHFLEPYREEPRKSWLTDPLVSAALTGANAVLCLINLVLIIARALK